MGDSMIRDYIYFDGKSLEEYGLYITNAGIYNPAERDYEKVSVPGRNGDLLFENDRFNNVVLSYPAVIAQDFDINFNELKSYLLSKVGYLRLEDSFHPDEYYEATFNGFENIKVTPDGKMGTFTLVFDRKPQKFLKSGETSIEISTAQSPSHYVNIMNPTRYTAKPLYVIRYTGLLTIYYNGSPYNQIRIKRPNSSEEGYIGTLYIDTDIMEAYAINGGVQESRNSWISVEQGDMFPAFSANVNKVAFYAMGVQEAYFASVIPRWWTV